MPGRVGARPVKQPTRPWRVGVEHLSLCSARASFDALNKNNVLVGYGSVNFCRAVKFADILTRFPFAIHPPTDVVCRSDGLHP